MVRRLLPVALLVLLAGASPAPGQGGDDKEQSLKLKERDPEFITKVNSAITRGVDFLKGKQLADGTWAGHFDTWLHGPWRKGMTAFCLLALLRSGTSTTDEVIEKGFKHLREKWENWRAGGSVMFETESWRGYEFCCMLMALEARWTPPLGFLKKLQGTQAAGGPGAKVRVPMKDLEWAKQLAEFLWKNMGVSHTEMSKSTKGGSTVEYRDTWSYPLASDGTLSDRSNTQFAVLGLQAAARMGVLTDDNIWRGVLRNALDFQQRKGEKLVPRVVAFEDKKNPGYIRYRTIGGGANEARGWAYYCGKDVEASGDEWARPMGSMTCCGISTVAICMEQLRNARKLDDSDKKDAVKSIRDGLAWLEAHWAVDKHPGQEPAQEKKNLYYYLYGMERAAVSADMSMIGACDWYGEGATYLLSAQMGDGSWTGDHEDAPACTSYALLFLTKGTVPPNIGVQISGGH